MEILGRCPHCAASQTLTLARGVETLACPSCGKNFVSELTEAVQNEETFNQCPLCGSTHSYRQKDFNRRLGIALVVIGVALAYFTYGISLVAVTLIDWWLVRRVGEVGCCYRCGAQFRATPLIAKMQPFSLPLYDYYKNRREGRTTTDQSPP